MKIGVLGGGQLGRMMALAGYPLGLDFVFFDPSPDACARHLGEHLQSDYSEPGALARFCASVGSATYEFENVPVSIAERIAASVPLYPGSAALRASQDRLIEKSLFQQLGIDVARYFRIDSKEDLAEAVSLIGGPTILKSRRMGYDGKGQAAIETETDLPDAWSRLGGQPLILEEHMPFDRELSCIAVRSQKGEIRFYPVIENIHEDGVLRISRPRDEDPLQGLAEEYTRRVLEHLDYIGILAFEFFDVGGHLIGNEIAPRVHNSGHWTIEGAYCSQFENHLRAVCGFPLGETSMRGFSAMINFIGSVPDPEAVAGLPHTRLHDYGKKAKPMRKVGHATVLAEDAHALETRISAVNALIVSEPGLNKKIAG